LADRGADVEAVEVVYPYETAYGTSVRTPLDCGKTRSISVSVIQSALGESLSAAQMAEALTSYGYACTSTAEALSVTPPPYRNDLMHPVDVAEDVAISVGYGRFSPIMPSTFTVGGVSRVERMSDRLRELLVGFGFQEVMSNILASRQDLVSRMRLTGTDHEAVVEIDNVMSQSFSCLRRSLLPSLLRVESASSRAFYPHRLFEVGEVAVPDPSRDLGSDTRSSAGALIAHAVANFSEAHSYLDLLMYYLDQPYRLEPYDHPSFLDGRGGRILVDDRELGLIGELHPEVLENWHIAVPCAAFELNVDDLAGRESGGTQRPE
jgi:phenylalanyl-tRNA synthetase beta chain